MNKYRSLFVGATVLLGTTMSVALPAHAQAPAATPTGAASGPFADVPADHWAYGAVNTLQKAGIVIGYPDGTYGGRRAMTRYEFAVAIARLLPMIQQPIDTSQFAKNSDLQAFENDVNGKLAANQAAIDALRALVNEFQPELQRLGQDVDAIKHRLDEDEQRLAVVEEEQRRVKITGDLNLIARGNVDTSSTEAPPLDKDGYRIGTRGNSSLWSNINVYHDFLLGIDGRVSDNAHAIVKLDASNYLPWLGSDTSLDPFRDENSTPSADKLSVYEAYLDVPFSLGPLSGGEAQIGRFGEQFTPFTLKGIDPDSYTSLPETDTGDIPMDGAKLSFGISGAHVQVYGAKDSPVDYSTLSGGPSNLARSNAHRPGSFINEGSTSYPENAIDQSAGARVTFGNPDDFTIGVTGLIARTTGGVSANEQDPTGAFGIGSLASNSIDPNTGKPYNNIAVYGVDGQGTLPFLGKSGLTADGEFAVNPTGYNSNFGSVNSNKGNEAYYAELGYTFGALNIKGGYKNVYANFAAPGFWGKLGSYTNPTNIEGGIVHASYAITPTLSVVGDGNFFKGQYNVGNNNPLGKNDKLDQFDAGIKYGLSSAYNVDLGYEWAQYNLSGDQYAVTGVHGGKPTEQYITIGVGHSFSQNASLKLLYQIINYRDKGTGFDPAGDSGGGVAVTQFEVKF